MKDRYLEFITGAEQGAIPSGGTPSADEDLINIEYAGDYLAGQPVINGTPAAPTSIVAGTGFVIATLFPSLQDFQMNLVTHVSGSVSGENDVSANPQISAPSKVGIELEIHGESDTNYLKLEHGDGLELNGTRYLMAGSVLKLRCVQLSPLIWREISFNNVGAP